jgi:hypothetical protein
LGQESGESEKKTVHDLFHDTGNQFIASTGLILSAPDTGAERLQAEKPRKASGMLFILVIQAFLNRFGTPKSH